MRKSDNVIIGIALIILVGMFVVYQKHESEESALIGAYGAGGGTVASTTAQNGTYTMADVAKHNDGTSCWSVINGNVYDLTAWIPEHPGGPDKILAICGIDGSAPFNRQHGTARLQQQILAGFKIGTLTQ